MATSLLFPVTGQDSRKGASPGLPLLNTNPNERYHHRSLPLFSSASVALDAYIGQHTGDNVSWKMRAKYEKDIEDLLLQKSCVLSAPSTSEISVDKSFQDDLHQYLNIRRIVDMSYEKLKHQQSMNRTVLDTLSAGDHLLRSMASTCTSPVTSHTSISQPLGTFPNIQNSFMSDSKPSLRTDSSLMKSFSPLSSAMPFTARWKSHDVRHHHQSVGALDTKSTSHSDDDDIHSGYHSDSSVDFTSKNTSLLSVNSDLDEHQTSSHSASQSPYRKQTRYPARTPNVFDDTLTQLYSDRKPSSFKVPSWVKELEESRSPGERAEKFAARVNSRHIVSPKADDSSFLCPPSPRKQLRFDMDATQVSGRSTVDALSKEDHTKQPLDSQSKTQLSGQLKTVGILKPARMNYCTGKTSFTMEDISPGMLQSGMTEERQARGHLRSFSASGRLSSTPIKTSKTNVETERPYISSLSSVHSATNTVNSSSNDCIKSNRNADMAPSLGKDKTPLPSDYLFSAVENANSISKDLGVGHEARDKKPHSKIIPQSPEVHFTLRRHGSESGEMPAGGSNAMAAKHRDYLRELVQDIEERSSSIGTGCTELQDVLGKNKSTGRYLDSNPVGSEATSDIWEKPWQTLPFRRHASAPDLSSVDSSIADNAYHHVRGGIVDRFLQECKDVHNDKGQTSNGWPSAAAFVGKGSDNMNGTSNAKPGTMEALKNMLFTMQSITNVDSLLAETHNDHRTKTDSGNQSEATQTQVSTDDAMSPGTKNLLETVTQHGGDSLQRALVHLERLKHMVKGGKDQLK